MPIAPFLALNSRSGTPQVERYVNASPVFIGAAIPGAAIDTDGTNINIPRGYPAVVKFGGSQTFIATSHQTIYRTTDGGATWASVKDLSSYTSAGFSVGKNGLWVLHVNGVATLVMMTYLLSTSIYVHKSTDGVSWTTLGPFVTP